MTTIRRSEDNAQTWPHSLLVEPSSSAGEYNHLNNRFCNVSVCTLVFDGVLQAIRVWLPESCTWCVHVRGCRVISIIVILGTRSSVLFIEVEQPRSH